MKHFAETVSLWGDLRYKSGMESATAPHSLQQGQFRACQDESLSRCVGLERWLLLLQLSLYSLSGWPYQWVTSDFLLTLLTWMGTSMWTASYWQLLKSPPMCWPGCCCSTCPGVILSLLPSSWVAVSFSSYSWCLQVWTNICLQMWVSCVSLPWTRLLIKWIK